MTDFAFPSPFSEDASALKRPASLRPEPNAPIEPALIMVLREIVG